MLLVDCTSSNNHEITQNPIKLRRLNPNENKENIFVQESSWWTKTEDKSNSFTKTTIHAPLRSDLSTKEHALNEGMENTNNFSETTQNIHSQENNYDKRNDTPLKLIVQTMTTWLEDELQHKTPKVFQSEEQVCISEADFEDITVELGFLDDFCSGASLLQSSHPFVTNENEITQWPGWLEERNSLSQQLENHQIWIDNFSFEGSFPDAEKDASQQQQMVAEKATTCASQSDIAEPEVQEGEYLELLPTMDIQVNLQDASIEESDTDSDDESDSTDEECEMDASFDSELDSSMDLDDHDRRKIEKTRKKNLKIKEKLLALSKIKLREVYRDSRNRRRPLPLVRKVAHQQIQNSLLAVSNKDIHLVRF